MKIAYLGIIDITREAAESRHVSEVCENWQRLGHEVTLFVPDVPGKASQSLSTKIVKVRTFGLKPSFPLTMVYNLSAAFHIVKHFVLNGIDLVYSRHSMLEFIPVLCLKPFAIRYATEINGLDSEQKRLYGLAEWKIRVSEYLDGICYRLADAIVTVTDEIRNFVLSTYGVNVNKVHVVSNGANVNISRPIPSEVACVEAGMDPSCTYLVFVGSLKKWHGVQNAILALKSLIGNYPRLKLLVVGDGRELKNLKSLAKREALEEQVIFAGKVRYDQVPYYINAGTLCLAPFNTQRNDLTGLSPLKIFEYMACGKPIVTTMVGGLERIIDEHQCGCVVEPDNLEALVEGIDKLLCNPELCEKLGRNGRRAAEEFYAWPKISERLLSIIELTR